MNRNRAVIDPASPVECVSSLLYLSDPIERGGGLPVRGNRTDFYVSAGAKIARSESSLSPALTA